MYKSIITGAKAPSTLKGNMTELKLTSTEKTNILTALAFFICDLNRNANQMIEGEGIEAYKESSMPATQVEFDLLWRKVDEA